MPTTIPPITVADNPKFTEAARKLEKLQTRLGEVEARQREILRETEDGRAEAAQAELDAVLRDDASRDPLIKRLREALKALAEETEELARTEAVLRQATSEQHKIVAAVREEASRPLVAAAVARWHELLAELETFTPFAIAVQQAFNSTAMAQGRPVIREDVGWCLTGQELARMQRLTEALVTRLRSGGYNV